MLALIAEGLTNTEIAERLVRQRGDGEDARQHIFAKAGVRDRAQAVVYAYSHGLAGADVWTRVGAAMSLTRLLLERFGLDAQLSPLPGEIDRNFALGDHVLKVHAGGTDPELLDLQDAAMEHVAASSLAVATPRLVRTRDGAPRAASTAALRAC